jgi:hypothetical protein
MRTGSGVIGTVYNGTTAATVDEVVAGIEAVYHVTFSGICIGSTRNGDHIIVQQQLNTISLLEMTTLFSMMEQPSTLQTTQQYQIMPQSLVHHYKIRNPFLRAFA